ncbi:MarR family winged helix-turn-helix transcriptional regulator [Heyndrickxia camelliae]|uniref:MarR family winged helix-turn-helix transcriptional regulator n=1 Tax=Heyndrickxia camelliae TaxID=1707093 RepID=UPI0013035EB4|nr:MarR family transcriptional regulator [Heyndrickxia camelliae]
MERDKIKTLIKRYEDVYLFATKRISSLISDMVLEDLSIEQYSMLRIIYHQGPLRAAELTEQLCVHKSAITAKVDKLESKGFISRERDQSDRRNVYITVTEEGKKICEKVELKIEKFVEQYLEELDTEDLELFINLYEKITNIIQKSKEVE